ncbi:unnamed protein product [Schistosoma intercalatum]|nr:unnamed protein product [Schistosoma intercalatum]
MSYTDHLSAFSNQSQRQQIMHDEEFSGTTYIKYMSKPPKSMFQDGDTNWIIVSPSEYTMPDLCITNMVLPLNVSNPSETAMIEHRESSNVLNSERPCFTSIEQNCSHRRVVDPTFYSQTNITKVPKMAQIGNRSTPPLITPIRAVFGVSSMAKLKRNGEIEQPWTRTKTSLLLASQSFSIFQQLRSMTEANSLDVIRSKLIL